MTIMRFRSLQPRFAERRTPQDDVSTILAIPVCWPRTESTCIARRPLLINCQGRTIDRANRRERRPAIILVSRVERAVCHELRDPPKISRKKE
jgi:hypothetical protein